jgi:hypothetical protein
MRCVRPQPGAVGASDTRGVTKLRNHFVAVTIITKGDTWQGVVRARERLEKTGKAKTTSLDLRPSAPHSYRHAERLKWRRVASVVPCSPDDSAPTGDPGFSVHKGEARSSSNTEVFQIRVASDLISRSEQANFKREIFASVRSFLRPALKGCDRRRRTTRD